MSPSLLNAGPFLVFIPVNRGCSDHYHRCTPVGSSLPLGKLLLKRGHPGRRGDCQGLVDMSGDSSAPLQRALRALLETASTYPQPGKPSIQQDLSQETQEVQTITTYWPFGPSKCPQAYMWLHLPLPLPSLATCPNNLLMWPLCDHR